MIYSYNYIDLPSLHSALLRLKNHTACAGKTAGLQHVITNYRRCALNTRLKIPQGIIMSEDVVIILQDSRESSEALFVSHLKQDAESLVCPFHNMSIWRGQDVVL